MKAAAQHATNEHTYFSNIEEQYCVRNFNSVWAGGGCGFFSDNGK